MIAECKESIHGFCAWYKYGNDLEAGLIIFFIAAILLMLNFYGLYKLGKVVLPVNSRFEERGFCNSVFLNDHLNNIIMFCLGFLFTIGLQSSSVATSLLVIPVAKEYLNLRNAYFIILGINLGTTITDIFSLELYDDIKSLTCSKGYLQIFWAHLFFNLCGCILFCLPAFQAPYRIGRSIAAQVDAYRWLVIVFFLIVFIISPCINLPFSMVSPLIFFVFFVVMDLFMAIIIVINYFQDYQNGRYLPYWIQNWNFLPLWMRSFDPAHTFFVETWTSFTRIPQLCAENDSEARSSYGMKEIVAEIETR